jgi:hypothetical protein
MRDQATELAEYLYENRNRPVEDLLPTIVERWPHITHEGLELAWQTCVRRELDDEEQKRAADAENRANEARHPGLFRLGSVDNLWREFWELRKNVIGEDRN